MSPERERVDALLSVDTPHGGTVSSYPEQQVLLVQGWYEDGQTCHLLRPDTAVTRLDGGAWSPGASCVVSTTTSDSGTEVVRHGLDGTARSAGSSSWATRRP